MGENVTFDLSVSALKVGICKKSSKMAKMINLSMKLKQKVASCGGRIKKNTRSLGESDERALISPKNVGSLGDSRDNQQKYGFAG